MFEPIAYSLYNVEKDIYETIVEDGSGKKTVLQLNDETCSLEEQHKKLIDSFTKPVHADFDNVDSPEHYISPNGLEAIDVINAFVVELSGIQAVYTANILKYILRWDKKNGLEDLQKARVYLEWLIDDVVKEGIR